MVKFSIALPGQPELSVALSRMAASIEDFSDFFGTYFTPAWYSWIAENYSSEGASTGEAWAALTAKYAAWKEKHYPGQPIGVRTGITRESLTAQGAPDAIYTVSKESFVVGTGLSYPIYLQMGTRRMVARPPMRVDDDFMLKVGKLLQRFGNDVANKQGLLPGSVAG